MNPDDALRRAVDAHLSGNTDEAEKLYAKVLKKRPLDPVALHYVGVIYYHRGEFDAAVKSIRKSIAVNENYAEAYGNLGLALAAQGKIDEATASYKKAIALKPDNADAYNNFSTILLRQGDIDAAIEACRKAVTIRPVFALAHYNLGVALQQKRSFTEAIQSFQQAIVLVPTFAEAFCNLGLALMAVGRYDEAISAYQRSIEIKPDFPEALNNLGLPFSELKRYKEAAEVYRRAIELRPDYVDATINLCHVLHRQGLIEEAIQTCTDALKTSPDSLKLKMERISLRRQICDWTDYYEGMQTLIANPTLIEPFAFLATDASSAQLLECATAWAAKMPRGVPFSHTRPRAQGKIRIGYLSSDLRRHATAFLIAELFETHDRSKFEVFGYSYGFDDGSEMRQRLIQSFDHFVDLQKTPSAACAQRIYDDKIDILIDLKGYTGESRAEILVDKPSPIQANYLGFTGTMGGDFMDYIIADSVVIPEQDEKHYAEKVVHLPNCYQPNDTHRTIATDTPTRQQCGLPEKAFVFCVFNGAHKITPKVFDIWMRLLKAVPDSVLWMLSANAAIESRLQREALARGIHPDRIVFAKGMDLPYHLARHRNADLFLDTLPFNAHTTASDALWAGLPIVTCTGEAFSGRVATSVLLAAGVTETITTSLEEYESLALDLATHPDKLKALRQKLQANLPACALFDCKRFTRNIEKAYEMMFDRHQKGLKPESFAVPETGVK
jgi:predicted O-linked N-acetylglucosamine transferase (SPINDLY family)